MTSFDVPQVSVQRYVELLKRRRWQVIPVSLLGLLIGGVVAFFIPRYFVADTTLTYETPPGEVLEQINEDPMFALVDSALATAANAIEPTVRQLGWEAAAIADPYQRSQALREIEDRLRVIDANPGKGRKFAKIRVEFRDLDGDRAANFVNTFVDTWVKQRLGELRGGAERRKGDATQRYNAQQIAYEQYLARQQALQVRYRIDPAFDVDVQFAEYRTRQEALARRQELLETLTKEVAGLQAKRRQQEERLGLLPARVPATAGAQAQAGQPAEVQAKLKEIVYWERALENYQPGNPDRVAAQKRIDKLKAEVAEDLARLGGGAASSDGTVPNPEHQKLVQQIDELDLQLTTKSQEQARLERLVAAEGTLLVAQAEGYRDYRNLAKELKETEARLEAARAEVDAANAVLGRLNNDSPVKVPVKAVPPPAPTEPSILLVALIGCVLGLGAATGLILLLDILQGSFKTIEDVERSLPVPVLGGMSHLVTTEERLAAHRRRRRVTLVTATLLVLVTGVVLLFYWDPSRLPPMVRDLLALVLPNV